MARPETDGQARDQRHLLWRLVTGEVFRRTRTNTDQPVAQGRILPDTPHEGISPTVLERPQLTPAQQQFADTLAQHTTATQSYLEETKAATERAAAERRERAETNRRAAEVAERNRQETENKRRLELQRKAEERAKEDSDTNEALLKEVGVHDKLIAMSSLWGKGSISPTTRERQLSGGNVHTVSILNGYKLEYVQPTAKEFDYTRDTDHPNHRITRTAGVEEGRLHVAIGFNTFNDRIQFWSAWSTEERESTGSLEGLILDWLNKRTLKRENIRMIKERFPALYEHWKVLSEVERPFEDAPKTRTGQYGRFLLRHPALSVAIEDPNREQVMIETLAYDWYMRSSGEGRQWTRGGYTTAEELANRHEKTYQKLKGRIGTKTWDLGGSKDAHRCNICHPPYDGG